MFKNSLKACWQIINISRNTFDLKEAMEKQKQLRLRGPKLARETSKNMTEKAVSTSIQTHIPKVFTSQRMKSLQDPKLKLKPVIRVQQVTVDSTQIYPG